MAWLRSPTEWKSASARPVMEKTPTSMPSFSFWKLTSPMLTWNRAVPVFASPDLVTLTFLTAPFCSSRASIWAADNSSQSSPVMAPARTPGTENSVAPKSLLVAEVSADPRNFSLVSVALMYLREQPPVPDMRRSYSRSPPTAMGMVVHAWPYASVYVRVISPESCLSAVRVISWTSCDCAPEDTPWHSISVVRGSSPRGHWRNEQSAPV
mmetsp:Transcript_173569/g.422150  ORF Transcript_173569/g.422150 Transcript_173569/m.422150 type:complete len:210 (-) Transcript_173569:473-1102(-)